MPPRTPLNVVGMDPSMRNWGIAHGTYDPQANQVTITAFDVINPVLPSTKQVRQNSQDVLAAEQLFKGAQTAIAGAGAVFVEVPHGSQSSRAMASYGLCVGVLGALRATGHPFFEVNAIETRKVISSAKKVSKEEAIAWALHMHPEAPWPYYTEKGQQVLSKGKAEHMADAIIAIYAGIRTPQFQQLLSLRAA